MRFATVDDSEAPAAAPTDRPGGGAGSVPFAGVALPIAPAASLLPTAAFSHGRRGSRRQRTRRCATLAAAVPTSPSQAAASISQSPLPDLTLPDLPAVTAAAAAAAQATRPQSAAVSTFQPSLPGPLQLERAAGLTRSATVDDSEAPAAAPTDRPGVGGGLVPFAGVALPVAPAASLLPAAAFSPGSRGSRCQRTRHCAIPAAEFPTSPPTSQSPLPDLTLSDPPAAASAAGGARLESPTEPQTNPVAWPQEGARGVGQRLPQGALPLQSAEQLRSLWGRVQALESWVQEVARRDTTASVRAESGDGPVILSDSPSIYSVAADNLDVGSTSSSPSDAARTLYSRGTLGACTCSRHLDSEDAGEEALEQGITLAQRYLFTCPCAAEGTRCTPFCAVAPVGRGWVPPNQRSLSTQSDVELADLLGLYTGPEQAGSAQVDLLTFPSAGGSPEGEPLPLPTFPATAQVETTFHNPPALGFSGACQCNDYAEQCFNDAEVLDLHGAVLPEAVCPCWRSGAACTAECAGHEPHRCYRGDGGVSPSFLQAGLVGRNSNWEGPPASSQQTRTSPLEPPATTHIGADSEPVPCPPASGPTASPATPAVFVSPPAHQGLATGEAAQSPALGTAYALRRPAATQTAHETSPTPASPEQSADVPRTPGELAAAGRVQTPNSRRAVDACSIPVTIKGLDVLCGMGYFCGHCLLHTNPSAFTALWKRVNAAAGSADTRGRGMAGGESRDPAGATATPVASASVGSGPALGTLPQTPPALTTDTPVVAPASDFIPAAAGSASAQGHAASGGPPDTDQLLAAPLQPHASPVPTAGRTGAVAPRSRARMARISDPQASTAGPPPAPLAGLGRGRVIRTLPGPPYYAAASDTTPRDAAGPAAAVGSGAPAWAAPGPGGVPNATSATTAPHESFAESAARPLGRWTAARRAAGTPAAPIAAASASSASGAAESETRASPRPAGETNSGRALRRGERFGGRLDTVRSNLLPAAQLRAFLRQYGYSIEEQEGDGNCLFRCIAMFLWQDPERHGEVRVSLVEWLRGLEGAEAAAALREVWLDSTEFKDRFRSLGAYADYISGDGVYAGTLELPWLTKLYGIHAIRVFRVRECMCEKLPCVCKLAGPVNGSCDPPSLYPPGVQLPARGPSANILTVLAWRAHFDLLVDSRLLDAEEAAAAAAAPVPVPAVSSPQPQSQESLTVARSQLPDVQGQSQSPWLREAERPRQPPKLRCPGGCSTRFDTEVQVAAHYNAKHAASLSQADTAALTQYVQCRRCARLVQITREGLLRVHNTGQGSPACAHSKISRFVNVSSRLAQLPVHEAQSEPQPLDGSEASPDLSPPTQNDMSQSSQRASGQEHAIAPAEDAEKLPVPCWFSGCPHRSADVETACKHSNAQHRYKTLPPLYSQIPSNHTVCQTCHGTFRNNKDGQLKGHGSCSGAQQAKTAYAKQQHAAAAVRADQRRAAAAADDAPQGPPPDLEPFHKFNSWEQWTRYQKLLLRLYYRLAGQAEARSVGSAAHRELQQVAVRIIQAPRFQPHKLRKKRNQSDGGLDGTLQLALNLLQHGAVGRAKQLLCSLGLAEVNQESMEDICKLFKDATLRKTEAASVRASASGHAPSSPVPAAAGADSGSPSTVDDARSPHPPRGAADDSDDDGNDEDSDFEVPQSGGRRGRAQAGTGSGRSRGPRSQRGATGAAEQSADAGSQRPAVAPGEASMYHKDRFIALCSERRDRAADATGWDTKMLLHLALNLEELEYCALVDVFQLIGEGAVDDPLLLRMLRLSRGHLLRKPKNGLRPAGSVSWWVQIPCILYLRRNTETVRDLIGLGNVAVSVRGGVEALPWAIRWLLEQNDDWCVMSTDCSAAFPSVSREALREAGDALEGLTGNVGMHYGQKGSTTFNELEFHASNGDVYTLSIPEGGNTGCAKLPALFCIALQRALAEVREHHPQVAILGVMDDNFLLGTPSDVLAAYAEMKTVLKQQLALDFNDTKAGIWLRGLEADDGVLGEMRSLGLVRDKTGAPCLTDGVEAAGCPIGTPEFVAAFLNEKFAKLDEVATKLEELAQSGKASYQGLLQLVQECVATMNVHRARTLFPEQLRTFAERVDTRMAILSLKVAGLKGAADDLGQQLSEQQLRRARIFLCSRLGGLGTPGLVRSLEPAFVGAAALIGPVIHAHAPQVNTAATGPTHSALASALQVCQAALPASDDDDDSADLQPPFDEPGEECGPGPVASNPGSAAQPPAAGRNAGGAKKDSGLSLKSLRVLDAANIFDRAVPKMQGRFTRLLKVKEQQRIVSEMTVAAQVAQNSGDHRPVKQLARFLEGARKHAGDWIRAPLEEAECHLLNGHFRIAVAIRLGVNPFADVSPGQRCSWCDHEVGDDLIAHTIECMQNRKGDNNRRHQWLQQALASLFKSVGRGQVLLHPRVLTVFGDGAHEQGYDCGVQARQREIGSKTETIAQNQRRQVDIGLIGVLARDEVLAIDLTVSDGGGSKPQLPYVPGQLCEKKAEEKHDTYHGPNGRFTGLSCDQLVVPSYDAMGGCSKETEGFTLHIIQAVAAAFPDVHPGAIARRVRATISCALIRSIAVNALDYRNGKLRAPSRSVGGLSPSSGSSPASQGSSGSRPARKRRAGSQLPVASPQQEMSQAPELPSRKRARVAAQAALLAAVALGGEPELEGAALPSGESASEGAGEAQSRQRGAERGPEGTGDALPPLMMTCAGCSRLVQGLASRSPTLF